MRILNMLNLWTNDLLIILPEIKIPYLTSLETFLFVEVEVSSASVRVHSIQCDKHMWLCPRIHFFITGENLNVVGEDWNNTENYYFFLIEKKMD